MYTNTLFQGHLFCVIRKQLRAFIILYIADGHTYQNIWEMTDGRTTDRQTRRSQLQHSLLY